MYNTSNAYKQAMRANSRVDDVTGTIYFPDGSSQGIDTSIISLNTLKISKQCIDGDELTFGGAHLGTLEIEIATNKLRYAFYGATITLDYKVIIGKDEHDENVWETVPLGIYTISEAEKGSDDKHIKLVGYDNLRNLDTHFGVTSIYGTAYEIMYEVAEATGIDLAFTESDISTWENADFAFTINADSGCQTYRDVVKIVGQALGAFCYATRDGKIGIRRFDESPIMTLTASHRYSIKVADYHCDYSALSITGLRGTFLAESSTILDGIRMDIEDCPAWDYGTTEYLQSRTNALFTYLSRIEYTPTETDMPGDPSFDCGDSLTVVSGSDSIHTIVTSYEWRFRNGMTLTSSGVNPYFSDVSDSRSQGSRINNKNSEYNEMTIYEFTNTSDVSVGLLTDTEIARCRFTATRETFVIFLATIQLNNTIADVDRTVTAKTSGGVITPIYDGQGNPLTLTCPENGTNEVTVKFSLNDVLMPDYFIEQVHDGHQVITVTYPISVVEPNVNMLWKVLMQTDGGTIVVPQSTMKAVIFGSGLLQQDAWSGILEWKDVFSLPLWGKQTFNYSESINIEELEVDKVIVSDTFSLNLWGKQAMPVLTDTLHITTQKSIYAVTSEDGDYSIVSEDGDYKTISEG